eukprot:CAMPEP_0180063026 /NCGR_PEP_ID=MMETSP0985-20121206/7418_1 /TAXON_ID=483367 /ORGANISM="non described non described, Strain CCMP 2436" /LENGTH=80 /DNA_ID=CAMNT_0021993213 /DNA_START=446 /DNA_END=685 /DNA_ORIENTATION=-
MSMKLYSSELTSRSNDSFDPGAGALGWTGDWGGSAEPAAAAGLAASSCLGALTLAGAKRAALALGSSSRRRLTGAAECGA